MTACWNSFFRQHVAQYQKNAFTKACFRYHVFLYLLFNFDLSDIKLMLARKNSAFSASDASASCSAPVSEKSTGRTRERGRRGNNGTAKTSLSKSFWQVTDRERPLDNLRIF